MQFIKMLLVLLIALCFAACGLADKNKSATDSGEFAASIADEIQLRVGAERLELYLPRLEAKSVAVVANATSRVGEMHLVDALLEKDINVKKVFAPEHGFRGDLDAGQTVTDHFDAKTGLEIFSLYGSSKKPSAELLDDVDIMVFDIQDVGVRFYTYLSTLHYVMEACAENDIPLILLDRPNPNGGYIDGPVMQAEFSSFIGLHPVPLVYGMTIGEYGQMINGERWLIDGVQCDLTVIKIEGYSRGAEYTLPVKPSPNLPNMTSIYLYPSLALFEGTVVSIGRGTEFPFQVVGHPDYGQGPFQFTPRPTPGAMTPKLEGQICKGLDLRGSEAHGLSLEWIIEFYNALPDKDNFFLANGFFNKLSGNDMLMAQIKQGLSATQIRQTWQADIAEFKNMRARYLLYK